MKSILAYGQAVYKRNRNQADSVQVFHAGVNAVTNIVTVNGTEYLLVSLSYDGSWYNVIKIATGEQAYLNADTVEANK